MNTELMAKQRAARLARDTDLAEAKRQQDALCGGGAQAFWDCVDTSGGMDACHPWRGSINTTWTTYAVGKFELEGYDDTPLVHRIACFLTFGRPVPKGLDVAPLCDNHLCCNTRHMIILPSSKVGGPRHAMAVPAAEFFCTAVAAAG